MKKLFVFSITAMLIAVFSQTNTLAESTNEIVKKANLISYYAADDGKSQLLMKVFPKGKKKPIKKFFYMLKKDLQDGGEQFFLTYFTKPSDILGVTFLVHKKIKDDDIRRLYIPAADKVLAIAGSRKQDPFMGSDFSYEDVSGRHHSKDTHKLLGEETINGEACYLIESLPVDGGDKIGKKKLWIRKSDYIPLRVEFYDRRGKLYKYYLTGKVAKIQGVPTILKRSMYSTEGSHTILLTNPRKVKYNLDLPNNIFSERFLRNPPLKYFK